VTIRFGQGGDKQTKTQTYATVEEARDAVEEMVAEKFEDGFTELVPPDQVAPPPAPVVEVPPAAPAPKPAKAPKAAAPAPAAADAGFPAGKRRFEFSEGTSNKFWELELQGKSFTVTYGKIGTAGQTKTKDCADEAAARKEHDKLVKEKTGKGYQEV